MRSCVCVCVREEGDKARTGICILGSDKVNNKLDGDTDFERGLIRVANIFQNPLSLDTYICRPRNVCAIFAMSNYFLGVIQSK